MASYLRQAPSNIPPETSTSYTTNAPKFKNWKVDATKGFWPKQLSYGERQECHGPATGEEKMSCIACIHDPEQEQHSHWTWMLTGSLAITTKPVKEKIGKL